MCARNHLIIPSMPGRTFCSCLMKETELQCLFHQIVTVHKFVTVHQTALQSLKGKKMQSNCVLRVVDDDIESQYKTIPDMHDFFLKL